ncbi:2Fe-2S iron-sulfur cluster-binding protein [Rhizobium sp. NPDC090279]|uniref:2Fe-2S iron-sulfur cluster-binding protein n=1 Tax=Rhizobium sp. NPDC090279 TaxID=3364499 RepID=UPI00383B013C
MPNKVRVQRYEKSINVDEGQTILDAALAEGLDIPYDCRAGVCGTCKCALISGHVEMREYLDIALEREEAKQGFILACRATPLTDCEISLINCNDQISFPYQELQARVTSVQRVTHDIAVVRLQAEAALAFAPGQYVSARFADLAGRYYSLANVAHSDVLEFHIRSVPGGAVSPVLFKTLNVGDEVIIAGPRGMAYFRKHHTGPVVLCAGGSGLAPIMSMLRTLADEDAMRPIHLFFGVRGAQDIYFEKEITELANRLPRCATTIVLSDDKRPTCRRQGYLADVLRSDLHGCEGMKAYLCGPPIMIDTCRNVLFSKGLAREDCHIDVFWTPIEGN